MQTFDGNGAPASAVNLPSWFHRTTAASAAGTPTRDLPPDTGIRTLPVLHFYSPVARRGNAIPLGVEVGFTRGEAFVWYPQVDARRRAVQANSEAAAAARSVLLQHRGALTPMRGAAIPTHITSDPTRQLIWDNLSLTTAPTNRAHASNVPWVDALREFGALWVNQGSESERFVFYEAGTRERVALSLERGRTWRADHRHIVIRNRGSHAAHDVFVTHREGTDVFVFFAPSIPAGRSAGFVIEEHSVNRRHLRAQTRHRLRARLVDAAQPAPPTHYQWDMSDCVMGRDPAVPFEESQGHRLYAHEVDAVLDVWTPTFFQRSGTTIVYREDTDYLDALMPISLYTDMHNFIELHRLGLAVWKNAPLP